jgi:hypothetical protein
MNIFRKCVSEYFWNFFHQLVAFGLGYFEFLFNLTRTKILPRIEIFDFIINLEVFESVRNFLNFIFHF